MSARAEHHVPLPVAQQLAPPVEAHHVRLRLLRRVRHVERHAEVLLVELQLPLHELLHPPHVFLRHGEVRLRPPPVAAVEGRLHEVLLQRRPRVPRIDVEVDERLRRVVVVKPPLRQQVVEDVLELVLPQHLVQVLAVLHHPLLQPGVEGVRLQVLEEREHRPRLLVAQVFQVVLVAARVAGPETVQQLEHPRRRPRGRHEFHHVQLPAPALERADGGLRLVLRQLRDAVAHRGRLRGRHGREPPLEVLYLLVHLLGLQSPAAELSNVVF